MDQAPLTGLPARAGIGLRAPHHREMVATRPAAGWLEVHSENFFGPGGEPLRVLENLRQGYAISLHGVGLSLGSSDELSMLHLGKLKALVERIDPAAVSEHLSWSGIGGQCLHDLLPLPLTREAQAHFCQRVDQVQTILKRPLLIENLSSYLRFKGAEMSEGEFLGGIARRTGCGLLLDVNNLYVSARNLGTDPLAFMAALPAAQVAEIHLAGYEEEEDLLVDTHSRPVHDPVWALYEAALARFGPVPTLIEWDNDLPSLSRLLAEAGAAQARMDVTRTEVRHALAA